MIKSVWSRGLLYTAGIVINRIIPQRLFRFRVFRVYELQRPGEPDENPDKGSQGGVEVRPCESPEDLRVAKELTHFHTSDSSGKDRYSARLASTDGEPVGGVWLATGWFDEEDLGVRIALDPNQSWIFAAHVSKSHRGRGVYREVLTQVLGSEPQQRFYAAINPTNRLSMAAHKAFVKSSIGTCIAFRVFRIAVAATIGQLKLDRCLTLRSDESPLEIAIATEE